MEEASLLSVVGFWLSLAMISFLFLTDESEDGVLGGERIGALTYVQSSVRRKKASRFSWFSVENYSQLAKNDSIKTGADSAAVIALDSGGSLEIGENSLVILKDATSISNNFIQGTLIIRDQTGDRRIRVDENGNKVEDILSYRWVEPKIQQEFFVAPKQRVSVSFKWNKVSSAEPTGDIFFEISKNPNFPSASTKLVKVDKGDLDHIETLDTGRYYFHLKTADSRYLTETRTLNLMELKPLNLNPVQAYTLGTESKMRVVWNAPQQALDLYVKGTHTLELSKDESFGALFKSLPINPLSAFADIDSLGVGKYFARIRSQMNSFDFYGAPAFLELKQTPSVSLAVLTPTAFANLDEAKPIALQWALSPPLLEAVSYDLEISNGEKVVLNEKLQDNTFTWTPPSEGDYFIHVLASSASNKIAESARVRFSVGLRKNLVLKSPRSGESITAWPDSKHFLFQWENTTKKKINKYTVMLSDVENFLTTTFSKETKDTTLAVTPSAIKEGLYYWKVKAVADDGSEELSRVHRFDFRYPSLLSATEIKGLKSDINLRKEKLPNVKWSSVKDAVAYEIEILRLGTQGRSPASVATHKSSSHKYQLPPLKEGTYELNVWPLDPAHRRGLASKKIFRVQYGELLKAPKLRKPVVE